MKEQHVVSIQSIAPVTHDVYAIRVDKPAGYSFDPGQATEVAINRPGWENEKRPFTFTSLSDEPSLEFVIKSYRDHPGVTNQIATLKKGDSLIIHDVWGAIAYQGEGYFIAGGAGITPFIAILRQLRRENRLSGNKLFFANKTARDVILEDELKEMLGDDALFVLSQEESRNGYRSGYIDEAFLRRELADLDKHFYICGPDPMVEGISEILNRLGASPDAVVFEQ